MEMKFILKDIYQLNVDITILQIRNHLNDYLVLIWTLLWTWINQNY